MTRALLLLSSLCTVAARLLLARADRALGPPRKVTPPPGPVVLFEAPAIPAPTSWTLIGARREAPRA